MRDAEVVVCSARDASTVFGVEDREVGAMALELTERFAPAARLVCLTCSERGSVAVEPGGVVTMQPWVPATVVDRFGAGDAFMAGIVDSLLGGASAAEALSFAARLAALKCTVAGDQSQFSRADVDALGGGRPAAPMTPPTTSARGSRPSAWSRSSAPTISPRRSGSWRCSTRWA